MQLPTIPTGNLKCLYKPLQLQTVSYTPTACFSLLAHCYSTVSRGRLSKIRINPMDNACLLQKNGAESLRVNSQSVKSSKHGCLLTGGTSPSPHSLHSRILTRPQALFSSLKNQKLFKIYRYINLAAHT